MHNKTKNNWLWISCSTSSLLRAKRDWRKARVQRRKGESRLGNCCCPQPKAWLNISALQGLQNDKRSCHKKLSHKKGMCITNTNSFFSHLPHLQFFNLALCWKKRKNTSFWQKFGAQYNLPWGWMWGTAHREEQSLASIHMHKFYWESMAQLAHTLSWFMEQEYRILVRKISRKKEPDRIGAVISNI